MTEEPKQEPAHLRDNRPVIALRSLLVGAASVLPVPGVSEAMTGALRRGLLRHVASLRHVDIEDDAVDALLSETPKARRFTLVSVVSGAASMLRPRRALRRMFVVLQAVRGVEESARMFQMATLFDHYCAVHHLGASISVDKARRLRTTMEEAGTIALREVTGEALSQIAGQAAQLVMAVPTWIWSRIRRTGEPPALPSLAALAASTHNLLSSLSARRYLGRLTESFDRKWSGGTVITVN